VSKKKILTVRPGEKGVRQSEAVFQHVMNLQNIVKSVFDEARQKFGEDIKLCSVGVSDKPRCVEGSYMPCFMSGVSAASAIAASVGCPLFAFSHQEGHIRSAILGSGMDSGLSHFYSFHLSGGTCELLEVFKREDGYDTEIIADSSDITLGQLIDRTGVMLGLQFPCGVELEKLASKHSTLPKVLIKQSEHINLSGFENKIQKMLSEGVSHEEIAAYAFGVCVSAITVMLKSRKDYTLPILFSGGVSSSYLIKNSVSSQAQCYFAPPMFSADNAIGIASLAMDRFK
jgi:N6-L-threonylcarbamoyladenine synthase